MENLNQGDIVEQLWLEGYFIQNRQPTDISKEVEKRGICPSNITMVLKSKRFKKKIKRFGKNGWKEIRSSNPKGIKKTRDFEELKEILGERFQQEFKELEINMLSCPNSTAFIMRKILEKLMFLSIVKSDFSKKIEEIKNKENRLPNFSELMKFAHQAKINNIHIISPSNYKKIEASKFLGDNSAHNYLSSISFEDIKNEITYWRMAIKDLGQSYKTA